MPEASKLINTKELFPSPSLTELIHQIENVLTRQMTINKGLMLATIILAGGLVYSIITNQQNNQSLKQQITDLNVNNINNQITELNTKTTTLTNEFNTFRTALEERLKNLKALNKKNDENYEHLLEKIKEINNKHTTHWEKL